MAYLISDDATLEEFSLFLQGQTVSKATEFYNAIQQGSFELDGDKKYFLKMPLVFGFPVIFNGNGAEISGTCSNAVNVISGGVEVSDVVLTGFPFAVNIDGLNKNAENIFIHHITINDPGFGICFNVGNSESFGKIKGLRIEDCKIISGYTEEMERNKDTQGALAFNITAACPRIGDADITDTLLDGLTIKCCEVLGARRFGVNMLVGVIPPVEGVDFLSLTGRIVNCAIRNVKVIDCNFDYCWEGGISLMCGCIQNYGSVCENLEVAHNRIVSGLMAIGYSGAGPVVPTSISEDMGIRHGSIHDNECIFMNRLIGEPNFGITLNAARAEGFSGIEVNRCFVEDVEIYNNTITGNYIDTDSVGIALFTANALTDEEALFRDNSIRNIRIYNNTMKDIGTAFLITATLAEGRRFDWNFGWRRIDQNWAKLAKDHRITTNRYYNNSVKNVAIENNEIDGCRNKLDVTGLRGRGHAYGEGNTVTEIEYKGNKFSRTEDHVKVKDVDASDWVTFGDGNYVDKTLLFKE